MGISIDSRATCGCDKNKELDYMNAVVTKISGSKLQISYQCPKCGGIIVVNIRLLYSSNFQGIRTYYISNIEGRLIVYVCHKCHKLIGTRENFFTIKIGKKNYPICEGCVKK